MRRIVFTFILLLTVATFAAAYVTLVEITSRADCNGGRPFGLATPYERLIRCNQLDKARTNVGTFSQFLHHN